MLTPQVATPGRCVDHIESTPGFAAALGNVQVLVLDEAVSGCAIAA